MDATEDEREALATRLDRKYDFFKRMSFDGSEHETMVLLREASAALRRSQSSPDWTDTQVEVAKALSVGGRWPWSDGDQPMATIILEALRVALSAASSARMHQGERE